MMPNSVGSRSMNIAPLSSRKLDMRPPNNAVKNVSGTQVKVCRDVENLHREDMRVIPFNETEIKITVDISRTHQSVKN